MGRLHNGRTTLVTGAATIAALLGEDFTTTSEKVAKPLPGVIKQD